MDMIERIGRPAKILHQTSDDAGSISETAVAAYVDETGIIVMSQECRQIVLNRASVPELFKMLRSLVKEYDDDH
jgi:hypothetical protein